MIDAQTRGGMSVSYYSAVVRRDLDESHSGAPLAPPVTERMSPALDELSLQFALWTRGHREAGLDIGCGDGIASIAALERGGRIVAVDPDESALRKLRARVRPEQHARLKTRQARIPHLDFKLARFSAVHVSRVLHELEPAALRLAFRKFFRWLYPKGKLFISALSASGAYWRPVQVDCARRHLAQDLWPGFIEDVRRYFPYGHKRRSVHLLDEPVLRRELEYAGFVVEHVTCRPLPWDADQMCCAVIARCGA